jgi:hypothetical protein
LQPFVGLEVDMIDCQGNCKEHRGTIKRVEVRDIRNRKDWGLFSYCDEAIEEDIRRGLDVSIIDHVPSFQLPNNCFKRQSKVKQV